MKWKYKKKTNEHMMNMQEQRKGGDRKWTRHENIQEQRKYEEGKRQTHENRKDREEIHKENTK